MSTNKPENSSPEAQTSATTTVDAIADAERVAPRGLSRRAVLGLGTAGAVAAGMTSAFGPAASRADALPSTRSALTGTLGDVKHVVVLMQENRSFDHYYGTLSGVRGFSDKQVLEYQNGTTIFQQPDPTRTDGGMLVPFRLDTGKYNAQNAGGLDHSWSGGHAAWNHGAWDRWVSVKGEQTMGYFTSDDLPYHHDLASEFTICDQYHCSLNGPTTPNRVFQWSGTNNPQGGLGGPAIDNPPDYNPVYRWGTYPEQLQNSGVSWKIFANDEVGDGANGLVGDYGDNPLWLFEAYHASLASTDPARQQLAVNGGLHGGTWKPDSGLGNNVHHVLADFEAACAAGDLPQVSYIVAPYTWCEHPSASPDYGAVYQNAVVQALFANPTLWESTVLLINYDENDGYFDHVMPPFPEAGTADEFVGGLPVGFGTRVPMTVVSPWSRGGWVNSQVFDHTSVIRFIETWTGVKDHNISDWRRKVSGDLTSCFDFAKPDFSIPRLTDTSKLQAAAIADGAKPAVTAPAVGAQVMPVQDAASRRHRPIPYQQNANVTVDHATGSVALAMSNVGDVAVSMAVYPNAHLPFVATPFTVSKSAPAAFRWDTLLTGGEYDFSVYGPNRFLRRFAGSLHSGAGLAAVSAEIVGGRERALRLTLENHGSADIHFSLTGHDFVSDRKDVQVKGRHSRVIEWQLSDGYYDVIVTTDTDVAFRYRFAGHIERRIPARRSD